MSARTIVAPVADHTIKVVCGKKTIEIPTRDVVDGYLRKLQDEDTEWQAAFTEHERGIWLAAAGVHLRRRASVPGISLEREFRRVRAMLMAARIELEE